VKIPTHRIAIGTLKADLASATSAMGKYLTIPQIRPPDVHSSLFQRVASSLVGFPILVFSVFWHGGVPFMLAVGVLCLLGMREFFHGCRQKDVRPLEPVGYFAGLLFLTAAHRQGGELIGTHLPAALGVLMIMGLIWSLFQTNRSPIRDLGATLLGTLYVGWLFSYLILLRNHGGDLLRDVGGRWPFEPMEALNQADVDLADVGAWMVLFVVMATWACDTGAYFTGRAFGRHKLAPALSPGKTVEGSIGGFFWAVGMALLLGRLLSLPVGLTVGLGMLIGSLGQVGDLCESAIKRDLGLKDFGSLLPGHGGVLDRFDSLLLTAPAVYYALTLWVQLTR
jgi:phosphatidate cytidylyltransferase